MKVTSKTARQLRRPGPLIPDDEVVHVLLAVLQTVFSILSGEPLAGALRRPSTPVLLVRFKFGVRAPLPGARRLGVQWKVGGLGRQEDIKRSPFFSGSPRGWVVDQAECPDLNLEKATTKSGKGRVVYAKGGHGLSRNERRRWPAAANQGQQAPPMK